MRDTDVLLSDALLFAYVQKLWKLFTLIINLKDLNYVRCPLVLLVLDSFLTFKIRIEITIKILLLAHPGKKSLFFPWHNKYSLKKWNHGSDYFRLDVVDGYKINLAWNVLSFKHINTWELKSKQRSDPAAVWSNSLQEQSAVWKGSGTSFCQPVSFPFVKCCCSQAWVKQINSYFTHNYCWAVIKAHFGLDAAADGEGCFNGLLSQNRENLSKVDFIAIGLFVVL